jgi:uncharacterized protein (DUF305 family)
MKIPSARRAGALLPAAAVVAFIAACGTAARAPERSAVQPAGQGRPALSPAEMARADSGRPPYTRADAEFISGMIDHHAQAVLMAGWAPSHGANGSIRGLAERIVVAQRDEIAFMQRWLRERREPVPDADASHMMMAGMDHKLMPGMLTPEQLTQLNQARGADFDRLFLTFMIQHHEGAITMVDKLFSSNGAGQDEDIFKFASDVHADQTTEIDRMSLMLKSLSSAK